MQLRIARHTNDLQIISRFYVELLGLKILGEFENHDGYNGILLGPENASWHLEFTCSKEAPDHHPDEDDLLVFYPQSKEEFEALQQRLLKNGILKQPSKNPYWNRNGICISDPDGFPIVISPQNSITKTGFKSL
ncbi:MAG: VOC family protein [Salinimicrobium sp.]